MWNETESRDHLSKIVEKQILFNYADIYTHNYKSAAFERVKPFLKCYF